MVEAIAGLRPIQGGSVKINGVNITNKTPQKVRETGIAHIPEDRNLRGICKDFTVYDNLAATRINGNTLINPWWRNEAKIAEHGDQIIEKYDVCPPNGKAKVGTYSGGNAQKIVVAREVEMNKPLLIAAQPTRGVDVGSIESIRAILNKVKSEGQAVLLISADLDEILALSNRIIVMYEGRICGEFSADNVDIEELGMLMMGGKLNGD